MRQNFDPSIWGPHAWFFLETITMAYPDEPDKNDINNTKLFFNSLQYVIPCDKCRNNYKKHLSQFPLTNDVLKNRNTLFKWIVDVHNSVDYKKKKSYDDVFSYYITNYSDDKKKINRKSFFSRELKNSLNVILITFTIIFVHKIYKFIAFRKK